MFSPCIIACARGVRAGLTVYQGPSRTLEHPRFMRKYKAEVSKRQYSSKAKGSNIRDFAVTKNTVHANRTRSKKKKRQKKKEPAAHAIPPWSPTGVLSMPEGA